MTTTPKRASPPRVRWKTLALPNEHGAWAFLLEPVLLGMLVLPSAPGAALIVAGFGGLLMQHPLSLALADARRGRRYPRTLPAWGLAALYALVAGLGLGAALALRAGPGAFLALALALPLAGLQLAFDAKNQGRHAWPELAGAVALGSLAAAIVLAGGGTWVLALSLWGVIALRNVPSILYVRTRLRVGRGQPARPAVPVSLQALALLPVAALVAWGPLPASSVVAFAILAVRAALGLRPGAPKVRPARTGALEMVYGLLTVAIVTIGLALEV